jgi:hypothetical protein
VGLELGPLSLVRITEELFQGNSGSGLEKRKLTTVGDSLRWPRDALYPLKLALTSPTSGGHKLVGIVRLWIHATQFSSVFCVYLWVDLSFCICIGRFLQLLTASRLCASRRLAHSRLWHIYKFFQ